MTKSATLILPEPTNFKTDWPWISVQSLSFNTKLDFPKISIVTPSYNQGHYLEETIRSVLLQGYPNLEYIIIDGGSTDNSVEIIKRYEPWLTYWVNEKDNGQVDAINKGLKLATGDLIAFINSDDIYSPSELFQVADIFNANPNIDFLTGACIFFGNGVKIVRKPKIPKQKLTALISPDLFTPATGYFSILQPSTFWRKSVMDKIGFFDPAYHFCFDREYWLRAYFSDMNFYVTNTVFSYFRLHETSKTVSMQKKFYLEDRIINEKYKSFLSDSEIIDLHNKLDIAEFQSKFYYDRIRVSSARELFKLFKKYIINSKLSFTNIYYWDNILSLSKSYLKNLLYKKKFLGKTNL